jgi:hypothetical protein
MYWHCCLKVKLWSASGAHALGVKIFKGREPRLSLLQAEPGSEHVITREFGYGGSCTGPDQMLISIPLSGIFRGAELPAALLPAAGQPAHSIVLDLFKLKQLIHKLVQKQ